MCFATDTAKHSCQPAQHCHAEAGDLFGGEQQPTTTFYALQLAVTLAAGAALMVLPSAIVEAPEPMYSAETLMRRFCGCEAAVLMAAVNWVLLQASKRRRLGASTFKLLNGAVGGVNCLVRPRLLHRLLHRLLCRLLHILLNRLLHRLLDRLLHILLHRLLHRFPNGPQ